MSAFHSSFQPPAPRIRQAVNSYRHWSNSFQGLTPPTSPAASPSPHWANSFQGLPAPPSLGAPSTPPAGPTAQSLPFDPVYEQTVSNNGQRLTDTLAGIQNEGNQDLTAAGYTQNGDQFALDPSNPFSRAALLQRHYDQSQAGATNGLAARGQLYSGALQNAQNENRFQLDQGNNANLSSLQAQLQALAGRRTGAISDAADSNTSALGTSITNAQNQAIANRPTNAQNQANASLATPKQGYTHVATSGPHVGESYNETKDSKGRTVHVYANGQRVTLT